MIGLTVSLLQALDFSAVQIVSNHEDDRLAFLLKCDRDLIDEHFSGLRLLRFQNPLVISKSGAIGSLITQTKSPDALVGATFPLMLLDQMCADSLTSASLLVFFDLCSCLLPGFQCFTFDLKDRSSGHYARPKCSTFQTSTEQLWQLLIIAEVLGAHRIIQALSNRVHRLICPSLRCTLANVLPIDQQCSCMTTSNTTVCRCLPDAASKAIPVHLRAQIVRTLRQRLHDHFPLNSVQMRVNNVCHTSFVNVPRTAVTTVATTTAAAVPVNMVFIESSSSSEYKQDNNDYDQTGGTDIGDGWNNNEGELSMSFARVDSPPRPHSPPQQQPRQRPVEQQLLRPYVEQAVEQAVREFFAGAVYEQLVKPQQDQEEEQEQEQQLIEEYEAEDASNNNNHHLLLPRRARSLSPTLASIGGKMRAVQLHASAVNRPPISRALSQPPGRPTTSRLAHRSLSDDRDRTILSQTTGRSTHRSNNRNSSSSSSSSSSSGNGSGSGSGSGRSGSVTQDVCVRSVRGEMYDMHGRYLGTRREQSNPTNPNNKIRSQSSRGREKQTQQQLGRLKTVEDEALVAAA